LIGHLLKEIFQPGEERLAHTGSLREHPSASSRTPGAQDWCVGRAIHELKAGAYLSSTLLFVELPLAGRRRVRAELAIEISHFVAEESHNHASRDTSAFSAHAPRRWLLHDVFRDGWLGARKGLPIENVR
jgi:hypothetical protein